MRGADRISSLPDPVLHRILSLLKLTEVVRTRILSTCWKHLWTCVPILKFYSYELRDESKFERFLNFVFKHRQTMTIDTFELQWSNCTSTFEAAERWLSHVVKCEPKVIVLATSGIDQYLDFADYVFTCESLEELNLRAYTKQSANDYAMKPKSVNLKHLKKLEIASGLNVDDDFMRQMMLGAPVLEELELTCSYEGLSTISSETLKHLYISWELSRFKVEGIEISIPSLVSLHIVFAVLGSLSCNNLESLVEAHIDIDDCIYEGDEVNPNAVLLCGLSNATRLRFYNLQAMEMFEHELPNCPIFNNLKEMTCCVSRFYPIAWFLQHAPNLEKLTLQYYYGDAVNLLSYNKDEPDDIEVKLIRW